MTVQSLAKADIALLIRITNLESSREIRSKKELEICLLAKDFISSGTEEDLEKAALIAQSRNEDSSTKINYLKNYLMQEICQTWPLEVVEEGNLVLDDLSHLEKIDQIAGRRARRGAYKMMITSLTSVQNWDKALEVANSIPLRDSGIKNMALNHIARGLIHAKEWERAFDVTKTVSDSLLKRKLLDKVVPGLLTIQKWELAVEAAVIAPQNPMPSTRLDSIVYDDYTGKEYLINMVAKVLQEEKQWNLVFILTSHMAQDDQYRLILNAHCEKHFRKTKQWENAIEGISRLQLFNVHSASFYFPFHEQTLAEKLENIVRLMFQSGDPVSNKTWIRAYQVAQTLTLSKNCKYMLIDVRSKVENLWGIEEKWKQGRERIKSLVEPLPFVIE